MSSLVAHNGKIRLIRLACILVLLLLIGLCYRSAPNNSFHFDDRHNIVDEPAVHMLEFSIDGLAQAVESGEIKTRPLPNLTFAIDWWRGQGTPRPFIQTNILLHSLVAIAGFVLLAAIFRHCGFTTIPSLVAATAAVALWATHPIQVQAVSFIVQRMTSMAALFVILAMFSYLKARTGDGHRPIWWILCFLASIGGAMSKENAWMTPAFLLLVEFGVVRHGKEFLLHKRMDIALLLLPLSIALLILADILSGFGPFSNYLSTYEHREFTIWERLLTQPRVIAFHLSQFVWPSPERFSIAHDFVTSTSIVSPASTLLALLAVILWVSVGIWMILDRQRRVVGFFLLFIPIALVPESTIIPLEMVFEHRMYLPSIALAGLVGYALLTVVDRTRVVQILPVGVLVLAVTSLLILATQTVVARWKDDHTLWSHALKHAPQDPRVHDNLSHALRDLDKIDEALEHAEIAVRLDPTFVTGLHNLGRLLQVSGDRVRAYQMFDRALRLVPDYAPARFSLGMFYLEAGDFARAQTEFALTLKSDPYHSQARLFYDYATKALREASARPQ
jgi:hypothetical protein